MPGGIRGACAGAARARGLAPGRGQPRWTGELSASTSGENSLSSYILALPSLTARELLARLQAEVQAGLPGDAAADAAAVGEGLAGGDGTGVGVRTGIRDLGRERS